MNKQEIKIVVSEIIEKKLGISRTEIDSESTLKELGADSLDELEIILDIERRLKIILPDDITPEVQTIGNLCKFIEKKI